jgi:hypothetical protein
VQPTKPNQIASVLACLELGLRDTLAVCWCATASLLAGALSAHAERGAKSARWWPIIAPPPKPFCRRCSQAWASARFFLDVPGINRDAIALAEDLGLTPVFETARMYTGKIPPLRLERIFGVTSFELG